MGFYMKDLVAMDHTQHKVENDSQEATTEELWTFSYC
jgi:hypothetical protein